MKDEYKAMKNGKKAFSKPEAVSHEHYEHGFNMHDKSDMSELHKDHETGVGGSCPMCDGDCSGMGY